MSIDQTLASIRCVKAITLHAYIIGVLFRFPKISFSYVFKNINKKIEEKNIF